MLVVHIRYHIETFLLLISESKRRLAFQKMFIFCTFHFVKLNHLYSEYSFSDIREHWSFNEHRIVMSTIKYSLYKPYIQIVLRSHTDYI